MFQTLFCFLLNKEKFNNMFKLLFAKWKWMMIQAVKLQKGQKN